MADEQDLLTILGFLGVGIMLFLVALLGVPEFGLAIVLVALVLFTPVMAVVLASTVFRRR